jgi:O-antigen/teichoic acid export membrane protein
MAKNYDHLFNTDHLRKNLKQTSVRGSMSVMSSHMLGMGIEVASVVVMARLLTPQDFGLIGMVLTATHFAKLFKDIGLSMATVQRAEITHDQVSLMFWVNVAIGVGLTVVTAASAPLVARFYGEPKLVWITAALSLSFLFSASAIQHQALMRRQMKFGPLAVLYVGSIGLSVGVGIASALAGLGYWSLVLRNLSQPLIYMIGTWWMTPWMPGRLRLRVGGRSLLAFGAHITAFNVLNYFTRNVDKILIGKRWGVEELGYYAQAYKVLLFPINQIRQPFLSVGIPALSALQNQPEEYRRYYRNIIGAISLLSMPLVGLLFVCADSIILLFLGRPWLPAAAIFRWLALVALIQPAVTAGRGLPMLSTGQGRRYFVFGLVNAAVTVAFFFAGIPWGAVGVAIGYVVSNLMLSVALTEWCMRGSPLRASDFFGGVWRPLASALTAIAGAAALKWLWLDRWVPLDSMTNAFVQSVACAILGGGMFCGLFMVLPGGRAEFSRYGRFGRDVLRRKHRSRTEARPT